MAIARYAAKLTGLYPHDPLECLRVDMVSESLVDVKSLITEISYRTPDEAAKAEKTQKLLEESVPKTLKLLEGLVQKGPFFLDDKMTYADLQLFDLVQNQLVNFDGFSTIRHLDAGHVLPQLSTPVELIRAHSRIYSASLKSQGPTTMAQPQLKLTYFDGKGRAELPRLIFNYGGIAFTDDRIAHADFAALKPTLPFGQVPVLEVDGVVYAQSMAISRYAAKLAGLYPSDAVEGLKADMFSCSMGDLEGPFVDFMFKTQDETEKAQKKKVFIEETVPKFFAALEKAVAGKFILGDKISYADLQFFDLAANKLGWAFPDYKLDAFPKLAAVVANVKAEPKIAAYLSKQ
ncbi:Glutathione S-transferase [Phytophthora megakarya]|uniref:Glutathione S-transferase n=1 Tax=Phytophthora megakarya TaxID=4795 RepID=A0A225UZV3_9STRA|nr:Glutathione S-transferase [Phytophthora megakarya]